ncbi:EAL domain, c-di-GMP-specific phosphodiesterase class I (or its enzymatically inactive variant) [Cupriavidus necator]|uniref:Bifunctional diguanylate cyclase/phosphodiesterase n=2 Tax=Cupriavidus necator TaxID=106590 RepID=Q0K4P4_CUPNH|nr:MULTISPECIES: bifunctional diguanylate cyclase/phosphodiesterase [Cupriavidus]EON20977.1 signal transduction protein [Cupriavidus sp. GA3-3]QCC02965.1 bifunctional diguanylate cyclase/phosphodiesterase [Cupriavidus necator H16]QQB80020.1 EAL domain-containing protein [Cupriavidus necator]WKA44275.1 EAL domain-containing protein [Cupriavidus necator]CAJ95030.1 predicted signal transduction protein containinga membrane domain, an EAL and a GGDEF domain [Cupriavidus necator H16]
MIALSSILLLLAALLGVAAALGVRAGRADQSAGGRSLRMLTWSAALLSQLSVSLPVLVVMLSGSVPAANDTAQMAASFAAAAAATAAAKLLVQWLRQGTRLWRGAALMAVVAGAGLVAAAGTHLGRACGAGSVSARACIDAAGLPHPAWLAGGLTALCALMFAVHRAQSRGLLAAHHEAGLADELVDEAHGLPRGHEPRLARRGARIPGRPGRLTVRAAARGQGTVGEYSVATTMPDRVAFGRWLDQTIAQARLAESGCAVLLIHIADYREVDEVFEIRADDILAQDAGALAQAVLEPHDFLARLARDEFAVGVPELVHHGRAQELGSRMLGSLAEFIAARGLQMQIGVNIGIAIYPRDAQTSEALMQAARVSLAEARQSGSNQVRLFNSAAGERARRTRVIRRDLWLAIQDDALSLQFQPKYDARRRTLVGAEALCRWRHPALGQVSPAEFITVAEQSGQIDKLDDWVLTSVCRQVRQWRDAGVPTVPVAINVSGLRFASRNFPQYLLEQIHQHDIPPSAITLEITETAAMKDIGKSLETLAELQSLGIQVALDDFGSGYSSLGYLKRLRVGTLKIDRTLIGGLDTDAQGRAIVGSMVALAHELRMKVVAEGVESASQLEILNEMGCDEVQGYLLSLPLDAAGFADALREQGGA